MAKRNKNKNNNMRAENQIEIAEETGVEEVVNRKKAKKNRNN